MLGPRLLFVVAVVVQCLLWSHSRTVSSSRLLHPTTLTLHDQCRPPSFPLDSQCHHTQESCALHPTFLAFDYLTRYFCTAPALRPLFFTGLLFWLLFLFSTLGISASDFFTPNLATLAQLLHLDENVAGVTFLAFGNGSPDVFSTFSAMRAGSGSLAIGELLGAASFIVSCVVGSMCIIKPFKVDRGPFLRDVGFFTVAVGLLLFILWDNKIEEWEAASLVVMYVVYVTVVVVGSWWERRRERKRRVESLIRAEYQENEMPPPFANEEMYRDDPSTSQSYLSPIPKRNRAASTPALPRLDMPASLSRSSSRASLTPSSPHFAQMPSFSLVGALEFRQVVASLQNQSSASSLNIFESPITPYAGGHYHSHHHSRPRSARLEHSQELNPWDSALGVPLDDRVPLHQSDPGLGRRGLSPVPSIIRTPASPTSSQGCETDSVPRTRAMSIVKHTYQILFPSLDGFRNKTFLGKIAAVFAAPAILALTLTLPVIVTPYDSTHMGREKSLTSMVLPPSPPLIDFEEEGTERALIAEQVLQDDTFSELVFNKWLMATQCILGPVFCAGVLFRGAKHLGWVLLGAGVGGLCAAGLVAVFAVRGQHPVAQMARCSMGFFVAIVWIMAIADEVVNVLQTFGFIFGLSDAIIGLTVFAVGNSLADFVANMSVAVFAPIMGFSACFGGPMLNILLGVGVAGTYVIQNNGGEAYALDFSTTLMVSSVGVLALLGATLVFVPLNGYLLSKRWGMFLIGAYVVIMGLNVFVEVS